MKLLLQSNGGFTGFYSKFLFIDADSHKMVKTDSIMKDDLTSIKYIWNYLENEKIPDIDDFDKSLVQDFDCDISLLECFLPTAQVITNTSIVIMEFIYHLKTFRTESSD